MADIDKKPKLEVVQTPPDALDLSGLWLDPALGDGITETVRHKIPLGKPRDFFRTHPEKSFRRPVEIYRHRPEGVIEDEFFALSGDMKGTLEEAAPPLSVADVGVLEYMRRNPGVRWQLSGGQGMNEMLEEHTLERVLRFGRSGTGDEEVESAPIRLNTVMLAEPGKTISGDDLYNLFQAAKAEGVTVTSKLHELKGVSIQTQILPGPGVVLQATRFGRKRRGDRQLRAQDRAWRERQKRGQ